MNSKQLKEKIIITLFIITMIIEMISPYKKVSAKSVNVYVSTQTQLDRALADSKVTMITIRSKKNIWLVIKEGSYKNIKLVINAPKGIIENSATFKKILIKSVEKIVESKNHKEDSIPTATPTPKNILLKRVALSLDAVGKLERFIKPEPTVLPGTPMELYTKGALYENDNTIVFRTNFGLLTEEIDTTKLKYVTSLSGDVFYNLRGTYKKVEMLDGLSPGEYFYTGFGDGSTYVNLKLTDTDADAIKRMAGYGNSSVTANNESDMDGLIAENSWYPGTGVSKLRFTMYNIIDITNSSSHNIVSKSDFVADTVCSKDHFNLRKGDTSCKLVLAKATKITFYDNALQSKDSQNGYIKIVEITPDVIARGIRLDDTGWKINEANNSGQSALK